MPSSTLRLYDRLALVFDFDDTLAPDCLKSFLRANGSSMSEFDDETQPLIDGGWSPILARMWVLVQMSRSGALGGPVTRERLAAHGRELTLHAGAIELFDRVRDRLKQQGCSAAVELYIVSAGIGDIIEHAALAQQLDAIYASRFAFDDDGVICFPKRTISHTEKTRYLLQIARGVHGNDDGDFVPDLHSPLSDDDVAIPFSQMIYVGDGYSDVPCFSLMNSHRGIAIGVVSGSEPAHWQVEGAIGRGRRVDNLAPASFAEGSELLESILLGVDRIAATIELRRLSVGE